MNTQIFDFESFRHAGEQFMATLVNKLNEVGLPANSLQADHLCFRVGTAEDYTFFKTALAVHGELLTEAMVNGRPISTFRLKSPFQTRGHEIPLLELPSPKQGASYQTGFEHAEFVIKECFSTFRLKHPQVEFFESGNQTLNPELCLKLSDGIQAKFHHIPLDRVIELEEAEIKDIIFDFDGTLVKSREHIYEINRIVFSKALGREVSLHESIANFHPEFSKLFEAFAVTCPIKQGEAIESWGTVASNFPHELFDGALETLQALKTGGYRLHLWTARDEYSARHILRAHGIEDFFETLSFATNVDSKPHANSLRFDWKTAERNKVVVVGDSPSDIIGAKNIAAIGAAALWDTYSKREALIQTWAELFFHEIEDFRNWVLGTPKEAS